MEKPTTKNTVHSKAVIHIRQRNQKLYIQAKAKRIQHHESSFTTNAKGISLSRKENVITRNKKIMKWECSPKHTVKVGSHPHTNMISKLATVRRGEHKCRKWELHLKLRDKQLKTILYIYRLLYQNLMGNANQKTTTDIHTKKKKQPKHNTKDGHQTTKEENKRGREEKRPTKTTQNN